MNFYIKQNILLEHLNYVIKGVSSKNLIPILNCIKFELTEDGLYLYSTDSEISIKTFIDKKDINNIDSLGTIVVSGKYIYDIIKKLPNSEIRIEEVNNNKIIISTSSTEFSLNCNEVSDFPNLELDTVENPIILDKKVLKDIINQISFATSNQESRPNLTGINFIISNDILECTGTDSYRLSKKILSIPTNNNESNIIIPTRCLLELIKIINDNEGKIEMHIFSNKVLFKFDDIIFMTRLINSTFPDTSKLISNEFINEIEVSYKELYNAIDRASLFSVNDDKNTILCEVNEKNIKISSNIPEIGKVEEVIFADNKTGDDFRISFSSKFMVDALKALSCEKVVLKFNGELKPFLIKNSSDDSITELIVPIRTY